MLNVFSTAACVSRSSFRNAAGEDRRPSVVMDLRFNSLVAEKPR